MGMTALKRWRLIVPGILVLILVLFVIQESFTDLAKTFSSFQWNDILYTILAIAIGVFYSILKIRKILWNPYLNRVQINIKNTLLSAYKQPLSKQQQAYLVDGRKLMIIFYNFIDNDNSLKEKAMRYIMLGIPFQNDELIFSHEGGNPLLPDTVSHAWTKIVERTGLKHFRMHDARHTHASLLLKQNVHPKVVQERLGHATISTTLDLYSHVAPGLQEAAARHFDEAFNPEYNDIDKVTAGNEADE